MATIEIKSRSGEKKGDSRNEVRGTRCEERDARNEMRGTRCEERDARCEMRDARCEMRDARCEMRIIVGAILYRAIFKDNAG
ncbi:hypothetical protein AOG26_15285 [Pseudoalteromonas sp. UCD-33C]|nr:hypothetical protein AOG26_15285 [Pseudoalteromonas sp. UCD-33C]